MGKASVFQTEERGSSPRYGSHWPADDAGSSNGRTLGFGPGDEGSNPSPAATPPRTACDPAFVPRAARFDPGRWLHASVAQPAEAPGRGPGMARVRIPPDARSTRRRSPTGRGVAFRTRRFGVRIPATARGGLTERQGAGLLTRGRVHPRAGSNPAPSARRRHPRTRSTYRRVPREHDARPSRGGHREGWRSPVSRPSRKRWPGSHLRGFESLTFRRRAPSAPVRPVGLDGQGHPALTRGDARFESGTGHSPYAQLDQGPFDHGLGRETFTLAERVRVPQGLRRSGAARSARVTHDHEVPGSNPGSATRPRQPAMPGATPL